MPERSRAVRAQAPSSTDTVESAPPVRPLHDAELDALLDEIDAVLEPDAEEFVRGYVQKGGE
ncbi:MAG: ubiquitin-like protein Pup [Acidobacteria bacterium]|nr:ubiquitin-like protein Pup [Acidobacteriota bacterium]